MNLIKRYTPDTLHNVKGSVCNPAIYRKSEDAMVMIYRDGYGFSKERGDETLKYCHIDNEFNLLDEPQRLLYSNMSYGSVDTLSDPRCFEFRGKPHLMLTWVDLRPDVRLTTKIGIAACDDTEVTLLSLPLPKRIEKNWAFFEHRGELYFQNSMWNNLHVIGKVEAGGRARYAYVSEFKSPWPRLRSFETSLGPTTLQGARPTTNLVRHAGLWWGMFHVYYDRETIYMGFYAFDDRPPFNMTYMTAKPLFPEFYDWKPQFPRAAFPTKGFLFPTTLILENENWIVGMGTNNAQQMDIITIPHKDVMQKLKRVST